jgi:hypothetical protein
MENKENKIMIEPINEARMEDEACLTCPTPRERMMKFKSE